MMASRCSLRAILTSSSSSSSASASSVLVPVASSCRATATAKVKYGTNTTSISSRTISTSATCFGLGGLNTNSLTLASTAELPPSLIKTKPVKGKLPRKVRRLAKKKQRALAKKQKRDSTLAARLGLSQAKVSPYVRRDGQFKTFKPITHSLRWVRYTINDHLHRGGPQKSLTIAKRNSGGRNHHGRITVRGRGGGHRRRLRAVDFWRWEAGPQEIVRIERDPGRSAHIALIKHSVSGRLSYIVAPEGLRAGDVVESYRTMKDIKKANEGDDSASALDLGIFRTQAIRPGNVLPLRLIPIGTIVHNISLSPIGPAKFVRSAGSSGQLIAFSNRKKSPKSVSADAPQKMQVSSDGQLLGEEEPVESYEGPTITTKTHAQVKLQSGEVRLVAADCVATIGRVSNIDHQHIRLGKAGRSRWLGRRPKVRGVAMNACDHPHGGGRGKSKSNMYPKSIWGHLQGTRTRKPGTKRGNRFVIRERPRQNGKRANK